MLLKKLSFVSIWWKILREKGNPSLFVYYLFYREKDRHRVSKICEHLYSYKKQSVENAGVAFVKGADERNKFLIK